MSCWQWLLIAFASIRLMVLVLCWVVMAGKQNDLGSSNRGVNISYTFSAPLKMLILMPLFFHCTELLLSFSPDLHSSYPPGVHFPCLSFASGACLVLLWSCFVVKEIIACYHSAERSWFTGRCDNGCCGCQERDGAVQLRVGRYQEGRMVGKGSKH